MVGDRQCAAGRWQRNEIARTIAHSRCLPNSDLEGALKRFLHKRSALELLARYVARKQHVLWRGALAGAIGGLAASGIVQLGQSALSSVRRNGHRSSPPGNWDESAAQDPTIDVTTAMRQEGVPGGPDPSNRAGRKAGASLRYCVLGSSLGALYGAISELAPVTSCGAGAPFGAAVWAASDIGSATPGRIPALRHAQMLGMLVAYGFATDAIRRCIRTIS
jgi:hypothetical protein